jgi:hypothetical protein
MPDQIKTEAGKELFKHFNDNYGSIIWGPILKGILDIEKEMENDISQTLIGKR